MVTINSEGDETDEDDGGFCVVTFTAGPHFEAPSKSADSGEFYVVQYVGAIFSSLDFQLQSVNRDHKHSITPPFTFVRFRT